MAHSTRRSALGFGGSAALAVLLAACAPTQAPPPAPARGAPAPAGPAGSTATGPTEWVVALAEETPSLDPIYGQFTAASSQTQNHIFDTLVQYVGLNLTLAPMLAESWKLLDDQTWEFSLRKGVKFQNGDELTANDVKYSLDLYKHEKSPRRSLAEEVTGVEVVDPEQRRRVLQEFGHYVHDQAYWMFIHAQNDFRAKRKDVPWELSPGSSSVATQRYYRLGAP